MKNIIIKVVALLLLCSTASYSQEKGTNVQSTAKYVVKFKSSVNAESVFSSFDIVTYEQLIPGFTPADRYRTNRHGEKVVLHDWSRYYIMNIENHR